MKNYNALVFRDHCSSPGVDFIYACYKYGFMASTATLQTHWDAPFEPRYVSTALAELNLSSFGSPSWIGIRYDTKNCSTSKIRYSRATNQAWCTMNFDLRTATHVKRFFRKRALICGKTSTYCVAFCNKINTRDNAKETKFNNYIIFFINRMYVYYWMTSATWDGLVRDKFPVYTKSVSFQVSILLLVNPVRLQTVSHFCSHGTTTHHRGLQ